MDNQVLQSLPRVEKQLETNEEPQDKIQYVLQKHHGANFDYVSARQSRKGMLKSQKEEHGQKQEGDREEALKNFN